MRTITLPALGSFITGQGGYLGAIIRGAAADGSQDYAVIVPEEESAELKDVAWSQEYAITEGASSKTDGAANTAAMAAAGLELAKHITSLELHGHKDWYLPSAGELRALSANVSDLFHFDDYYWSSTQYSRYYAWCQDFELGFSNYVSGKVSVLRARPVRKIPLSHFNA